MVETNLARDGFIRKLLVGVLVLGLLAFGGTASAAPGDLDPTFDGDGKVIASFGDEAYINALALQPDGKMVVGGQACDNTGEQYREVRHCSTILARYAANGSPDTGFGDGGKIMTDPGVVNGLTILPEGDIVAAGTVSGDFFLTRYEADGTPATAFGDSGKVITDFEDRAVEAVSLAVQPDGKLVVAGHYRVPGTSHDLTGVVLARYEPDGSLDEAFASGGKKIYDLDGDVRAFDLAVQPGGKLVVAGTCGCGLPNYTMALVRFETDGSLDEDFGNSGIASTSFGNQFNYGSAYAVAVQPDGKLVAAGYSYDFDNQEERATLVRYNVDGSEDGSFGTDGKAFGGRYLSTEALAIQSDGKIVTADGFILTRYKADGTLDKGFGVDGEVNVGPYSEEEHVADLAIQPDGKIVAAGMIGGCGRLCEFDLAMTRYDAGPANSAPVAEGWPMKAREDTAEAITLKGTDADGESMTFEITDRPGNGVLGDIGELSCSGATPNTCSANVRYKPDRNFNGSDSFTFRADDGTASSEETTVSISVKAINDAPNARIDRVTARKDGRVRFNVLANDSDPDGDRLTIERSTRAAHGRVQCGTGGSCLYVPDRGFRGRDVFTYRAGDNHAADAASVRIRVGRSR